MIRTKPKTWFLLLRPYGTQDIFHFMEYWNTSSKRQDMYTPVLDSPPSDNEKNIIAIEISLVFIVCCVIHPANLSVMEIEVIEASLLA